MATAQKKIYECEHCENQYNSRGPKSNHKFAIHYGGYDCDKCTANYKFRELLNTHYIKEHGQKTNPNQDFGHLTKKQRDQLDQIALMRKRNGLPGVVLSKDPPPFAVQPITTSQENTEPTQVMTHPDPQPMLDMETTICYDDPDIELISGPVTTMDPPKDTEIQIEEMDIIDLATDTIASYENTCHVVDRVMSKDVRLGVNLRAEMHQMALNTEKLFDEGNYSVEEILDKIRPTYN
jgi:hypothetical protein